MLTAGSLIGSDWAGMPDNSSKGVWASRVPHGPFGPAAPTWSRVTLLIGVGGGSGGGRQKREADRADCPGGGCGAGMLREAKGRQVARPLG